MSLRLLGGLIALYFMISTQEVASLPTANQTLSKLDSGTECANLLPGIETMFLGVDVRDLDLLPMTGSGRRGFKKRVIKVTCTESKGWQTSGTEFQLPDQVLHVIDNRQGWISQEMRLSKTSEDVTSNLAIDATGLAAINPFFFSGSASVLDMERMIYKHSKYVTEGHHSYYLWTVDLSVAHNLALSPVAKEYLRKNIGSETYTSNPTVYETFIEDYGTHYFTSGHYGGSFRMLFETEACYFLSHTDNTAKAEARAYYAKKVADLFGIEARGVSTTVKQAFIARTNIHTYFYGGSKEFYSEDHISSWQSTIEDVPMLLSGELRPISDLIKDPVQRTSMEEAVEQHLLRGYLMNLEQRLGVTNNAAAVELLKDVEKMKGQKKLAERDVMDLSQNIDKYVPTREIKPCEEADSSTTLSGKQLYLIIFGAVLIIFVPFAIVGIYCIVKYRINFMSKLSKMCRRRERPIFF